MDNEYFKKKYLKYKKKYLQLKKFMNGGSYFADKLKENDRSDSISSFDSESSSISLLTELLRDIEIESSNDKENEVFLSLPEFVDRARIIIYSIIIDLYKKNDKYKNGKSVGLSLLDYKNCLYEAKATMIEIINYGDNMRKGSNDFIDPANLPNVKNYLQQCSIEIIDPSVQKKLIDIDIEKNINYSKELFYEYGNTIYADLLNCDAKTTIPFDNFNRFLKCLVRVLY